MAPRPPGSPGPPLQGPPQPQHPGPPLLGLGVLPQTGREAGEGALQVPAVVVDQALGEEMGGAPSVLLPGGEERQEAGRRVHLALGREERSGVHGR